MRNISIDSELTDIKVMLGKIEEHMKAINGKVARHADILQLDCPKKHELMDNKITDIRINTAKDNVKVAVVQTLVLAIIIALATMAIK
jgi:hypothetical protein